jgi:hypothetical protein
MRTRSDLFLWVFVALGIAAIAGVIVWFYSREQVPSFDDNDPIITEAEVQKQLQGLPLSFQRNDGQVDEQVKFLVKNGNTTVFFTNQEIVFQTIQREKPDEEASSSSLPPDQIAETAAKGLVIRQKFLQANQAAEIDGENQLGGKVNYFTGDDPDKWVRQIPTFGQIRYQGIYDGVNVVYSGNASRLQQAYELSPGVHPDLIQIEILGQDSLRIDEAGNLVLQTALGPIAQIKPEAYQTINDKRVPRQARYRMISETVIGFAVTGVDPSHALIIES